MPLTTFNRLGLANPNVKNALSFAQDVLRLPANTLIYQQQLVHNLAFTSGVGGAAEYIGSPDVDAYSANIIREVSVHHTPYARPNYSATGLNQITHRRSTAPDPVTFNQIYYLNNEPEGYGLPTDPLDPFILSSFPGGGAFWESKTIGGVVKYRATAAALAYTYLRLRAEMAADGASNTRGHILLPPSSVRGRLGAYAVDNVAPTYKFPDDAYWKNFYDAVLKNGASSPAGPAQPKLLPDASALQALHMHQYEFEYTDGVSGEGNYQGSPGWIVTPMHAVAAAAFRVIRGANWFKVNYSSATPQLPLDILLSETGFDWRLEQPNSPLTHPRGVLYPYHWAGGWTSFKQGLSWWNTWLWWLTRRANVDCNLQTAKSLFACVHNPDRPPYVTQFEQDNFPPYNTWTRSNLRQQNCFNCDSWTGVTYLNAPCVNVPALNIESGTQPFQRSFSAFNGKSWQGSNWYVGPFGASLKVWSAVGSDPVVSSYGSGWWLATANGMSAQGSVSLTAGFNTVYIPVIKRELGVFGANDEFRIYFVHSNGTETWVGSGKLAEIPDSVNFTGFNADFLAPSSTPINIEIQSSMVYPVVCYSATNRTIGVKIQNLSNGRRVYYGRPIALSQACSWFSTQ